MSIFNAVSQFSYSQYVNAADRVSKSIERLSTGLKRPTAADGAALDVLARNLEREVRGQQGINQFLQTYESYANAQDSYLKEVQSILERMSELAGAALASNGSGLANLNTEFRSLANEIVRINSTATFNSRGLFSTPSSFNVRLGVDAGEVATFSQISLGQAVGVSMVAQSVNTIANASTAMSKINSMIDVVNRMRTQVGAHAGIVERAVNISIEQIAEMENAASSILSIDEAHETSKYVQESLLLDGAIAALAQSQSQAQQTSVLVERLFL